MRRIATYLLATLLLPGAAIAAESAQPVTDAPDSEAAKGSAILTIDQDALYRESAWGQRAEADLAARSRALSEENDRIADQLEAEDNALTELRKTLPADEFRTRADAFDQRVQKTRQERDEASRALLESAERDRNVFFNAAFPIFADVMVEHGALAILDRHTVFLASRSIDITDAMIARVDEVLGAGPDLPSGAEPGDALREDVTGPNTAPVEHGGANAPVGDAGKNGQGAAVPRSPVQPAVPSSPEASEGGVVDESPSPEGSDHADSPSDAPADSGAGAPAAD